MPQPETPLVNLSGSIVVPRTAEIGALPSLLDASVRVLLTDPKPAVRLGRPGRPELPQSQLRRPPNQTRQLGGKRSFCWS